MKQPSIFLPDAHPEVQAWYRYVKRMRSFMGAFTYEPVLDWYRDGPRGPVVMRSEQLLHAEEYRDMRGQ